MAKVRTSPVKPRDQRPPWDALKPMPESLVSNRKPLIIGHRGAKGLAPENTLAAFHVAAELGIDGVEFDVQRTRDGQLVVFHDENTVRVTGHRALVEDLTLDELMALDAGHTFDPAFTGERVPSLNAVFDFLRNTNLLLFIELKEPWRYPGIEADVIAAIRAAELMERVQLRSFYHDALHAIYHAAPDLSLSGLWLDRLPTNDEVTFKTVNAYHRLYTPEAIAHIHSRGQQATAWVVNNVTDARKLIVAGIDGLTSDHPDRLLPLVNAG